MWDSAFQVEATLKGDKSLWAGESNGLNAATGRMTFTILASSGCITATFDVLLTDRLNLGR